MKNILGLDLGVSSIGWAIVKEDEQKQELIKSGVRIIPIDTETANNYSKGASTSKNQDRQAKRSARRNNHRYKLRKHFLIEFLKENNLWPLPVELFNMNSIELYGLRDKAIIEKIKLEELARIWFNLNQKRGYIDSRKGQSEEDKDTAYVEAIKSRSKNLYDNYRTVGSYFFYKLKENPFYRIKSGDDKENIFLVDDYKIEFDLIWSKQKEYYPDFLNDLNFDKVRNQIIYYKRKLKSQKHLIGECRFELHHKCMPISSPIAEELRLWQDINKIRITNKSNEVFELTNEQKTDLFNYLIETEKISEKDILKRYQYPTAREGYKINIEKHIRGYVYRAKLIELFKIFNIDFTPYASFDAADINYSKHPYFQLWHLLYATEETNDIKNNLKSKYNFNNDEFITALIKLPIKNDFAALSSRAARKILPFLRNGLMYDKACKEAGYNHSNSLTKEENEEREIISIDKLQLIKPNELRNPTVEKILNQLINLLKGLNSDGYTFDEIRIELARDLKKNAKERKRINEQNRDNEKENNFIKEELYKHGFTHVSKRDIDKYKLWNEFNGCSPYEPNHRIELAELFDKAKYEIEHIIPKSRYFDDSFNNKTIARVHINKEKDNETAYDYMKRNNADILHQYEECVKHNTKISWTKRNNLLTTGDKIPDDFINRQLNETRYITSETLKILKAVCKNVTSTSGSVTDYLRHNWGYDNVLMDLNFDRVAPEEIEIKEINGQKRKVIKDWTKRNDNRHHAVDAIVIACTKQSYIQQLNKLNTTFDKPQDLKPVAIKNITPFNYEVVKNSISNILVSYKAGKKVATIKKVKQDRWGRKPGNFGQEMIVPRGRLHEETVYGNNHKQLRIDIKKLDNIKYCIVDWQRQAIEKHLTDNNIDLKTALKNLKKKPILYADNKVLEKVTVFIDEHVKKYNLEYSNTNKFDLKAATSIVNKNVRDIIINRLAEFDNDASKAFKNLKENPVYFNKEKGIVIKSVRCYTGGEGYPALHETANGLTLNDKQGKSIIGKMPVDFVKGGNNHHIAIYEDEQGNRIEECVTFFEAFERKRNKQPIIEKEHPNGYKFITSIQQNEMFIFGLNKQDIENDIEKKNYTIIGKHLFRVRNIAPDIYWFDNHLQNRPSTLLEDKKLFKVIQCRASSFNGIKVKISNIGKISIIN